MLKIIQFLMKNPIMVQLLKGEKISLVRMNEIEKDSILEAFEADINQESAFWG